MNLKTIWRLPAIILTVALTSPFATTVHAQGEPNTKAGTVKQTRLVILGTAAGRTSWRGSDSNGISSALQVGQDVYVVDFGRNWLDQYFRSGLGTAGRPNTPRGLETLRAGFITHLHADHIVDLSRLISFGSSDGLMNRKTPVQIYGPDKPDFTPLLRNGPNAKNVVTPFALTKSTKEMFDLFVSASSTDLNDNILDSGRPNLYTYIQAHNIELPEGVRPTVSDVAPDMKPFEVYKDENVRVTAILVAHGPIHPVYAYRFDTDAGAVVFSGDTAPCPNLVKLAKGATILVHEADDQDFWRARYKNPTPADAAKLKHLLDSHTDLRDVGKIAADAHVSQLVISHIPPHVTDKLVAERVTGFDGRVTLGKPGMHFTVGPK